MKQAAFGELSLIMDLAKKESIFKVVKKAKVDSQ